jgi:hypothetical protein
MLAGFNDLEVIKANGADGFLIAFKETFQGFDLDCDTAYVKPMKVQPLDGCATTDLTSIRSNTGPKGYIISKHQAVYG